MRYGLDEQAEHDENELKRKDRENSIPKELEEIAARRDEERQIIVINMKSRNLN